MSNPWGNPQPFEPQPFEPQPFEPQPSDPAYPGAALPYPAYPGGYPGPYPGGYPMAPPEHPQAVTAMVLGILGLVCCGFAAPFAIWLGRKSTREIDASGGRLAGRGQAQAGFIMGIIGTALWAIGLLFYVALFAFGVFAASKQTY